MDVKNTFLYEDLQEDLYMQQPPGLLLRGSLPRFVNCISPSMVLKKLQEHGLRNLAQFLLLLTSSGLFQTIPHLLEPVDCIVFIVYVDDIIILDSDVCSIVDTKKSLQSLPHIKGLGKLQYYLGIEVSRNPNGMY